MNLRIIIILQMIFIEKLSLFTYFITTFPKNKFKLSNLDKK